MVPLQSDRETFYFYYYDCRQSVTLHPMFIYKYFRNTLGFYFRQYRDFYVCVGVWTVTRKKSQHKSSGSSHISVSGSVKCVAKTCVTESFNRTCVGLTKDTTTQTERLLFSSIHSFDPELGSRRVIIWTPQKESRKHSSVHCVSILLPLTLLYFWASTSISCV